MRPDRVAILTYYIFLQSLHFYTALRGSVCVCVCWSTSNENVRTRFMSFGIFFISFFSFFLYFVHETRCMCVLRSSLHDTPFRNWERQSAEMLLCNTLKHAHKHTRKMWCEYFLRTWLLTGTDYYLLLLLIYVCVQCTHKHPHTHKPYDPNPQRIDIACGVGMFIRCEDDSHENTFDFIVTPNFSINLDAYHCSHSDSHSNVT